MPTVVTSRETIAQAVEKGEAVILSETEEDVHALFFEDATVLAKDDVVPVLSTTVEGALNLKKSKHEVLSYLFMAPEADHEDISQAVTTSWDGWLIDDHTDVPVEQFHSIVQAYSML